MYRNSTGIVIYCPVTTYFNILLIIIVITIIINTLVIMLLLIKHKKVKFWTTYNFTNRNNQ